MTSALTTSTRVLNLLSLLQARRFWTGQELAAKLGVTERSVRRDIDRLRSLGYPVHATGGVGGGYQLGAGKELPPLPLDDDEAVAVAIGLRAAATGPVRGLEDASVRALAKLEQVLPKRLRRRVSALDAVSVRMRDAGPSLDAGVLSALAGACRDTQTLAFDYKDHRGNATRRSVEPYRLVHTSYKWYLLAFDLERDDWRTFRLDRIGAPRPTRRFRPRALPARDLAEYVSQRVSTEAHRHRARITLHTSAEEAARFISPTVGRLEPKGKNRCVLHTGGDSLEGLAYHLGLLGVAMQVHEPAELVEHLRRIAARLSRAVGA